MKDKTRDICQEVKRNLIKNIKIVKSTKKHSPPTKKYRFNLLLINGKNCI